MCVRGLASSSVGGSTGSEFGFSIPSPLRSFHRLFCLRCSIASLLHVGSVACTHYPEIPRHAPSLRVRGEPIPPFSFRLYLHTVSFHRSCSFQSFPSVFARHHLALREGLTIVISPFRVSQFSIALLCGGRAVDEGAGWRPSLPPRPVVTVSSRPPTAPICTQTLSSVQASVAWGSHTAR